jgi:hypothetical protein
MLFCAPKNVILQPNKNKIFACLEAWKPLIAINFYWF